MIKPIIVYLSLLYFFQSFTFTVSWLAVSPIKNNNIDLFQLDNNGTKVKDILSIPVTNGEQMNSNAFTCGRCFCLLVTVNPKLQHSYLYNISFCLVPVPTLESKITLQGIAYNLHSNRGEGDGGTAYTILMNTMVNPHQYIVTSIQSTTVTKLIDISNYVDYNNVNTIYPGGTAFCADSGNLWISIQNSKNFFNKQDILLMVNVNTKQIIQNISLVNPALIAHFASCGTVQQVGGIIQLINPNQNENIVQIGLLNLNTGNFNIFDSKGLNTNQQNYRLSPIVEGIIMPQWENSYGSILYEKNDPFTLPGLLFVSYGGGNNNPPATFSNINEPVMAVADEY